MSELVKKLHELIMPLDAHQARHGLVMRTARGLEGYMDIGGDKYAVVPEIISTLRAAAERIERLETENAEAVDLLAEHHTEVARLAENDPAFDALMRQRYPIPPYSEQASKASAAKYREAAMLALRENITLSNRVKELEAALRGVIRVADRKTVEFDAARAALEPGK